MPMAAEDFDAIVQFISDNPTVGMREAATQLKKRGINVELRSKRVRELFNGQVKKIRQWIVNHPGLSVNQIVKGLNEEFGIDISSNAVKNVAKDSNFSVGKINVNNTKLVVEFIKSVGGIDEALFLINLVKDCQLRQ